MGLLFSKIWQNLFGKKEMRILMVGLNAVGKTAILYRLKLGEVVTTTPTILFNVETVEYKKIKFTVWDLAARSDLCSFWRHYYSNTQGLIFVVDSNDHKGVDDAREELQRMLAEEGLKDVILLVFANKQDLTGAMTPTDIAEKLGLSSLKGRLWHIQGCSAATGDGLHKGLDWLGENIVTK